MVVAPVRGTARVNLVLSHDHTCTTDRSGSPEFGVALGILGLRVELDIQGGLQEHGTTGTTEEARVAVRTQRKPLEILS